MPVGTAPHAAAAARAMIRQRRAAKLRQGTDNADSADCGMDLSSQGRSALGPGRRVGMLCSEYDAAGLCKAGFGIIRVR
ncbi:hypothetical protein CBM2586_A11345 [Cupriavidus phytorum]|uniref:Uncharacterized protein n=1 Tax=Cupriavidus taiwanensis TaxID=164546 RepID=A0A375BDR2_9BURK|nr:hypothetical protein CBM2586_A11345 [Cupriavidus taiwanensis]